MLLDELKSFVAANVDGHLQGLWKPDCESQIMFDTPDPGDATFRIPRNGNGTPCFDDTAYHPKLDTLRAIGVTGWNWVDGRSVFNTIDIDSIVNHSAGHNTDILEDLKWRLMLVDEAEIIYSKSGEGIHVRLYFDPDAQPLARTRKEHIANCRRALDWLSRRVEIDLDTVSDCVGVVAWIYNVDRKPNGFKLVKPSTAFVSANWLEELPTQTAGTTIDYAAAEREKLPLTPKHQLLIDWLSLKGRGELKDGRLDTHTYSLLLAAEDPSLKIKGPFATIATGKDGAGDRNCFCYPAEGGSWKVYRTMHRGSKPPAEHASWWLSSGGFRVAWFNRGKEDSDASKGNLLDLAKGDDLFHDDCERAFVTTTIRGVKETLPLGSGLYRAKLRLAYTQMTGRILPAKVLRDVTEHLDSIAKLERPEFLTGIRVAEHSDVVYIDLANKKRQIVKVTPTGWSIVDNAPVRFIRPFGLLPLPTPLAGGSLDEFKKFINIEDDDLPLLLAFMVACFHPTGPYCLLQVVGEQGSAKTSLMRLIHDIVDPNIAIGITLPKDVKDCLVAAQLRRVVSFDNVSELKRDFSNVLCMLVTGASLANRKLFTDDELSVLRAKRPILVTAIRNVVTASDLLDRTLSLSLPTISPENRMSEFAIAQELRRDGVRGRILGFILDGVVAALAGHASIKRDDMPRMADVFSWATAAEPAFGLDAGSAIEAIKRQATEESEHALESVFALAIIELCKDGFEGSASELARELPHLDLSAREAASELREVAPDLRRQGYMIVFRRSRGRKIISLSACTPASQTASEPAPAA